MKDKIFIFLAGFVTVLLLMELALRVIGFVHLRNATESGGGKGRDDKHFTVLCVGDSFVNGLGAPEGKDFPSQLQDLFDAEVGKEHFRVVNRGVGGYNTWYILNELEGNIKEYYPDLVILLVGGANYWNFQGYTSYLQDSSFSARLFNGLYRVRLFKLAKLLMVDTIAHHERAPAKKLKGRSLMINGTNRYKENAWKHARKHEYREAISWFENGLKEDPHDSDYYLGMGLVFLDRKMQNEALNCFLEGVKLNPTDSNFYYHIGICYEAFGMFDDAVKWFGEGIRLNPREKSNYEGASRAFIFQELYDDALEFFRESFGNAPFSGDYLAMFEKKQEIECEVRHWIESDIHRIIDRCRTGGIEVIMLNYPGEKAGVSRILKDAAERYDVFFVDLYDIFLGLLQEGIGQEKLYSPDGHCNTYGYGIIAERIYQRLQPGRDVHSGRRAASRDSPVSSFPQ